MLKKPQEEPTSSGNRISLPQESGIRSLAGIKELLAMAESSRGSQIELAWTTKIPEQRFVLDMQWDPNKDDPFWTLYEENAGKSKRLWDQPFNPNEIDLCYDILVMTCGGIEASTKNLAEILKVPAGGTKDEQSKFTGSKQSIPDTNHKQSSEAEPKLPSDPDANTVAPPIVPNSGFPPGYVFPPGMAMPMNPVMVPMPGYNFPMPGAMTAMPPVQPIPQAGMYPAAPSGTPPFQAAPPQSNWSYDTTSSGNLSANLPLDSTLLNKQNDIALLDLLIKAELLSEPSLAAAAKLHDLIQAQKLTLDRATEVLKYYHNKGESIEDYINAEIKTGMPEAPPKSGKDIKKSGEEDKESAAVFKLLEMAGIISAADIKTAQGVNKKHGGDLLSTLVAAQKLDEKTIAAAKICNSLQDGGQMKLEQCIILLNYCSRSRVSFDEAMNDLNWPNPRQANR